MEPFRLGKKEKKFRWRLPALLLLVGLILVGLFYLLLYAEFLKVKELKVEGVRSFSEETFLSLLESEIIVAGQWRAMFGSDNIVFWLGLVSDQIAARLPVLAGLEVKPDLLERKVSVSVKERTLAGVWCLPAQTGGENCFVFDEAGIVFASAPAVEGRLILKIDDENNRFLQPGNPVLPEADWFKNMATVLGQLEEAGVSWRAVQVVDFGLREWSLTLPDGPVFQFSFEAVPGDFGSVVANLKKEVDLGKLQYVDFRVPNKIYYR